VKQSDILFDADRRIQIADFSPIRVETGAAERFSGTSVPRWRTFPRLRLFFLRPRLVSLPLRPSVQRLRTSRFEIGHSRTGSAQGLPGERPRVHPTRRHSRRDLEEANLSATTRKLYSVFGVAKLCPPSATPPKTAASTWSQPRGRTAEEQLSEWQRLREQTGTGVKQLQKPKRVNPHSSIHFLFAM
jgi:hypothetical protein